MDPDRCAAAVVPLLVFAVQELGLRRITSQIGSEGEWLRKILAAQGFVGEENTVGLTRRGQHVWECPVGDRARHVGG